MVPVTWPRMWIPLIPSPLAFAICCALRLASYLAIYSFIFHISALYFAHTCSISHRDSLFGYLKCPWLVPFILFSVLCRPTSLRRHHHGGSRTPYKGFHPHLPDLSYQIIQPNFRQAYGLWKVPWTGMWSFCFLRGVSWLDLRVSWKLCQTPALPTTKEVV